VTQPRDSVGRDAVRVGTSSSGTHPKRLRSYSTFDPSSTSTRTRTCSASFSREPGGLPGWKTHRGEVYIVLGPPAFAQERYIGREEFVGRPNAIEWLYQNVPGGRLALLFLDRTGFGRYELSPSSLSAFRGVADRLKLASQKGATR